MRVAAMLEALRVPDFRLLWAGGLVSALGSWLLTIAVPAHVLLATGSLRATGLTVAAEYVPLLMLGPVAGVVADRLDRRLLMIAADLFCAGSVASMLLGLPASRYWVLYVALIAENSGSVLHTPALLARTPAIVGTGRLLTSANSLNALSNGVVRLIGGPVGGILLAVYGIRWLICADAASYLASAGAIALTARSGGRNARRGGPTVASVGRDLIDGIRTLRDQPVARVLLPVTTLFLAANASLSAVLIAFGVERLGGSEQTGFLLLCLGAGYLLGAPLIRVLLDRVRPRLLVTWSLAGTGAAYFLLFTSSSPGPALPAAAAVGLFGSMSLVVCQTTVQRVIPNAALGRVTAFFLTAEAAATLAGAIYGPFLAQLAQFTGVATVACVSTLSAAALAYVLIPSHVNPRESASPPDSVTVRLGGHAPPARGRPDGPGGRAQRGPWPGGRHPHTPRRQQRGLR